MILRLLVVSTAAIGLILFVAFVVSRLLRARTRGFSIRMQVFLALALIVGTFAFGLGLMVIDRIEARAVRLATQAARDEAESIATVIERTFAASGQSPREFVGALAATPRGSQPVSIEIVDARGRLLFPEGGTSRRGTAGTAYHDAPVRAHGEVIGSVRVVKPTIVMKRMLADFAPTVLVISLVLGAAAALAAIWIGRTIAHPIETITRFAERVSQGERAQAPALAGGAREVMRLSRAIDSMRRQIEGRPFVETFAADLSHELKNPVAAIRAAAEVLEEGALQEPERARRFVSRIRQASERIERLLRDLVSLARIEARGVESLETVDLGQVARTALEGLADGMSRFSVQFDPALRVRGDAAWLGRAISNLLDNALIHSPTDSRIGLALTRSANTVACVVESEGEVSSHVREQLFRRFVTTRADKGGSGLGLAIVRAVAEAHGGQVQLVEPGPPTVRISLKLPALRAVAAE